MKFAAFPLGVVLVTLGCSVKLPDIPQNHPGSIQAPLGQTYATPAVLEVRPFIRPPDRPVTQPAHPRDHEPEQMTPMGEMPRHAPGAASRTRPHAGAVHGHEHEVHDVTQTRPAWPDEAAGEAGKPVKRQQQMMREGQLHE